MAIELTQSQIELREAFQKSLEVKTKAFLEGKTDDGCGGANVLPQAGYNDPTCYCRGVRACPNRDWSTEKANAQLPYCKIRKHGI